MFDTAEKEYKISPFATAKNTEDKQSDNVLEIKAYEDVLYAGTSPKDRKPIFQKKPRLYS
jgi:hypothetical protein